MSYQPVQSLNNPEQNPAQTPLVPRRNQSPAISAGTGPSGPAPYPSHHGDAQFRTEEYERTYENLLSPAEETEDFQYPSPQVFEPKPLGATLYRYKTQKLIQLTPAGNYVVQVPVPQAVLATSASRDQEFTHLTYTAVCGDPDEFYSRGYSLRQAYMNRTTEIFIVVTMYNEDQMLFLKTWQSLKRNIEHMCRKTKSPVWDSDGWKKIVVCIVSDGREKINKKTLATIGLLGAYQEGLIKTSVNEQDVSAHIFEYTAACSIDSAFQVRRGEHKNFPVQVLFCLKEKNAKKINSHRWFFNAFGRVLNPNVCVLIDVGTKPNESSIYSLWKEFALNSNVAGACGEIFAELGPGGINLLNPLVAAQNFEYKMSNILDKPLESMFGFISVLPGAFSAYRYAALQNRGDGKGPLEKYFLGETMHGTGNLTKANMYLAEDRILCFELVTKRHEAWVLRYVSRAKAETDVPSSVPEYVSQRRRWLNGSFFAGLHAIINMWQIFRSGHSIFRKMLLMAQMLYNIVNLLFSWFAIGNFFLIFVFLGSGIVQTPETDPFFGAGAPIYLVLRQVYLFSVVMIFVASLGNRPQGSKLLYTFSFFLFATIMLLMLYMSVFTVYLSIKNVIESSTVVLPDGKRVVNVGILTQLMLRPAFRDLVLSTVSTYGVYIISSLLFWDPWHMITSLVQYLLMIPSSVNILNVYAFCNIHDVSWGTKGDNQIQSAPATVVVQEKNGIQTATVDLPTNQSDIDTNYNLFADAIIVTQAEKEAEKRKRKQPQSQEDYFRAFRTRVVLFWILSNAILIGLLTTPESAVLVGVNLDDPLAFNPFLTFILWSVAALSTIRFIGSVLYIPFQSR